MNEKIYEIQRAKSNATAIALCWGLAGFIGAHRFVAKKPLSGLLMISANFGWLILFFTAIINTLSNGPARFESATFFLSVALMIFTFVWWVSDYFLIVKPARLHSEQVRTSYLSRN